ncbi:MAG: SDR family oxidoreductase [Desulfarculus sp.]|nr:MAG: SDR family oxidoreductase [Desulfarculus sp.]
MSEGAVSESPADVRQSLSLAGQAALVTGASRGIGLAIARALTQAGAAVVMAARKAPGLEAAAAELAAAGGRVLAVAANVSRDQDRRRLVERALAWASRLDILVNNAGANPSYGPLAEVQEAAWDKVFAVNLKASLFLSQLAYRAWMAQHGGAILNVSSLAAYVPTARINAYSVTKAALNHLTACLASEWGPQGVRVNAIAPGLVQTSFSQALWESPEGRRRIQSNPLPRVGRPQDLAGAALLLLSPAGSFITGQCLIVDGGEIIKECGQRGAA